MKFRLLPLAVFVLSLVACSQEDDSFDYLDGPQTDIGLSFFQETSEIDRFTQDTTYRIHEGLEFSEIGYVSRSGNPVKLFIMEVDLESHLWIESSMPNNDTIYARQVLSLQALAKDKPGARVLGGVNGDYFSMHSGWPSGKVVYNGKILKTTSGGSSRTFFGIDSDGRPLIADNDDFPAMKNDLREVVGGSYWLVRDHELVAEPTQRDPRTAVGVSEDRTKVFFIVVDGRNPGYSMGVSLAVLGQYFQKLGAYNAVNLDGGGSSTLILRNLSNAPYPLFLVRNIPADEGWHERPVANGIMILTDALK